MMFISCCLQETHFFNWDSLHAKLISQHEEWSYKKKKRKNIKSIQENSLERIQRLKSPITLDLKPFRSEVKGKHSTGREFQSLAVRGKCSHRHLCNI